MVEDVGGFGDVESGSVRGMGVVSLGFGGGEERGGWRGEGGKERGSGRGRVGGREYLISVNM